MALPRFSQKFLPSMLRNLSLEYLSLLLSKILNSSIFVWLTITIVFSPLPVENFVDNRSPIVILLNVLKVFLFFYYCADALLSDRQLDSEFLLLGAFVLMLVISAALNIAIDRTVVSFALQMFFPFVIFYRLTAPFKKTEADAEGTVKRAIQSFGLAYYTFMILIILNLLIMKFIPQNLLQQERFMNGTVEHYRIYFLGKKNLIILYNSCFVLLSVLLTKITQRKSYLAVSLIVFVLSVSFAQSLTSIVAMLFSIEIMILILLNKSLRKHVNGIAISIALSSFLTTIFFGFFQVDNLVSGSFGISGIPAFTHRLENWQHAWNAIAGSPLIGYGTSTDEMIPRLRGFGSTHNTWLFRLLTGGIVPLLLFLLILFLVMHNFKNEKNPFIQAILLWNLTLVMVWILMETIISTTSLFSSLILLTFSIPEVNVRESSNLVNTSNAKQLQVQSQVRSFA